MQVVETRRRSLRKPVFIGQIVDGPLPDGRASTVLANHLESLYKTIAFARVTANEMNGLEIRHRAPPSAAGADARPRKSLRDITKAHEKDVPFGIISAMENDAMLFKDEVYAIQGAVFDVYRNMGNGWREEVYQQCLELELANRGIPFESKRELPIFYKGRKIEKTYIPDVICYGQIILELKAVSELTNEHRAQLLNYLRMTKSKLGLLINFAAYPKVRIERYAN